MTTYGSIHRSEVHEIEFSLAAHDGMVSIGNLKAYIAKLEENGFVDEDRVGIFGASTNQRAQLTCKRSKLYDNMNAMDKTVYDMENR